MAMLFVKKAISGRMCPSLQVCIQGAFGKGGKCRQEFKGISIAKDANSSFDKP